VSSNTETTLSPVTFVRDIEPGEVFNQGTHNKLYQREDGSFITTSWCELTPEHYEEFNLPEDYQNETTAYVSDDEGRPINPMVYYFDMPGDSASVRVESHEEALAAFGYKVVEAHSEPAE
jgi:hypothetical protein